MRINPFKESNLNDLQQNLSKFLSDQCETFSEKVRIKWVAFLTKGREKITIMFVPHSEKKIINFHVSIFFIAIFTACVSLTIVVTSIFIVKHSSTIKEISILKSYGSDSELQKQAYKDEINKLYTIFQTFKSQITTLYSLVPDSNIDSVWAMGGVSNREPTEDESKDLPSKEDEELNIQFLNIQGIESELKTTKELVTSIKSFLKHRKKIIENTPSIWPSKGYIISRYGKGSFFRSGFYRGIDIETFPGMEIISTAPGVVEDVYWDSSLGLTVSIKHQYGFVTSYSHCQRVSVEVGQQVSKGEVIGYVGKTGKTTKYLCYYQIKIGTEFVDPVPYLNSIIH